MIMTEPECLIISNKFDFSTDLITDLLHKKGVRYLRLNRDQFSEYEIKLDPAGATMTVKIVGIEYSLSESTLKSVYYRAPTFLREIFSKQFTPDQQLSITQWAAFIRALSVFENANWVNYPSHTYKAEIKALQLKYAKAVGFNVPESEITNVTTKGNGSLIAVKSIDSAIVFTDGKEAFVYTRIFRDDQLDDNTFDAPMFIQEALVPKMDIRVTVVGENLVAIGILGEAGIAGDWRTYEHNIKYEVVTLPVDIKEKCFHFMKLFNLKFGGIDLILHNDKYYFIEINPTGEWSWLQKNTGVGIDEMIVKELSNGRPS